MSAPVAPQYKLEYVNGVSICTYNLLAQSLISREWFPWAERNSLRWNSRQALFETQVKTLQCDIFAFQELDIPQFTAFWDPFMTSLGYTLHFSTAIKAKHGLLLAYRTDKFLELTRQTLRFENLQYIVGDLLQKESFADSPKVAQVLVLVPLAALHSTNYLSANNQKETNQVPMLFLANNHLDWRFYLNNVKFRQLLLLRHAISALQHFTPESMLIPSASKFDTTLHIHKQAAIDMMNDPETSQPVTNWGTARFAQLPQFGDILVELDNNDTSASLCTFNYSPQLTVFPFDHKLNAVSTLCPQIPLKDQIVLKFDKVIVSTGDFNLTCKTSCVPFHQTHLWPASLPCSPVAGKLQKIYLDITSSSKLDITASFQNYTAITDPALKDRLMNRKRIPVLQYNGEPFEKESHLNKTKLQQLVQKSFSSPFELETIQYPQHQPPFTIVSEDSEFCKYKYNDNIALKQADFATITTTPFVRTTHEQSQHHHQQQQQQTIYQQINQQFKYLCENYYLSPYSALHTPLHSLLFLVQLAVLKTSIKFYPLKSLPKEIEAVSHIHFPRNFSLSPFDPINPTPPEQSPASDEFEREMLFDFTSIGEDIINTLPRHLVDAVQHWFSTKFGYTTPPSTLSQFTETQSNQPHQTTNKVPRFNEWVLNEIHSIYQTEATKAAKAQLGCELALSNEDLTEIADDAKAAASAPSQPASPPKKPNTRPKKGAKAAEPAAPVLTTMPFEQYDLELFDLYQEACENAKMKASKFHQLLIWLCETMDFLKLNLTTTQSPHSMMNGDPQPSKQSTLSMRDLNNGLILTGGSDLVMSLCNTPTQLAYSTFSAQCMQKLTEFVIEFDFYWSVECAPTLSINTVMPILQSLNNQDAQSSQLYEHKSAPISIQFQDEESNQARMNDDIFPQFQFLHPTCLNELAPHPNPITEPQNTMNSITLPWGNRKLRLSNSNPTTQAQLEQEQSLSVDLDLSHLIQSINAANTNPEGKFKPVRIRVEYDVQSSQLQFQNIIQSLATFYLDYSLITTGVANQLSPVHETQPVAAVIHSQVIQPVDCTSSTAPAAASEDNLTQSVQNAMSPAINLPTATTAPSNTILHPCDVATIKNDKFIHLTQSYIQSLSDLIILSLPNTTAAFIHLIQQQSTQYLVNNPQLHAQIQQLLQLYNSVNLYPSTPRFQSAYSNYPFLPPPVSPQQPQQLQQQQTDSPSLFANEDNCSVNHTASMLNYYYSHALAQALFKSGQTNLNGVTQHPNKIPVCQYCLPTHSTFFKTHSPQFTHLDHFLEFNPAICTCTSLQTGLPISNHNLGWSGVLDHFFISTPPTLTTNQQAEQPNANQIYPHIESLRVTETRKFLTQQQSLPSTFHPSDHIPIRCTISFKP